MMSDTGPLSGVGAAGAAPGVQTPEPPPTLQGDRPGCGPLTPQQGSTRAANPGVDPQCAVPLPSHPMFQGLLPAWVSQIRDHQWTAVQEVLDAFATNDLVVVDAPTGSGKSLLARIVQILSVPRSLYICSGKTLQSQFLSDFPDAHVLMGRSNYPTLTVDPSITCADCTGPGFTDACVWCTPKDACPYQLAKSNAAQSPLAVLNTSYFLAEASTRNPIFGGENARPLVVIDEADVLEKELMGHVEVSISPFRMKQLRISGPKHVTKPDSWAIWVRNVVLPAVHLAISNADNAHASETLAQKLTRIRTVRTLKQLRDKLLVIAPGLTSGNWVFDGYNEGRAIFRPVRVDSFGEEKIWRHGDKFLLMSATVISTDEVVQSLGYEGSYTTVRVPMTFPVANRRVHVAPVANMTRAGEEAGEWLQCATAIDNILKLHPDERVLVHTVSYKLATYLQAALRTDRPVLTYTTASERDATLDKFRSTAGSVLLASSMDRGVDLRDDDCRVVVVAKVPYPYLGDKQVSARLHSQGGQLWYSVSAVRSLVQMTGRATRSATDWSTSYILDRQFLSNVWKNNRGLLPQWWVDALDFSYPVKQLTKELH